MIRVAFLVHKLDTYGGAAAQALSLARGLDPREFEVTLFNVSGATRLREDRDGPLRIVHLPGAPLRRLLALAVRLHRFDLVHLHGQFLSATLCAVLLRRPVVLKTTLMGDDDFDSLRAKPLGRLRLALARRSAFNNALTAQLRTVNARYIAPDRIGTIPNGVRIPAPTRAGRDDVFVFVGALVPRKRPHLAIEYFAAHYAGSPGAKLVLLGPFDAAVPEFDAAYLARLQRLAATLPAGSVEFAGRVERGAVDAWLGRALALLFFSAAEGMPNAVLEAMAHDCVPVVTPMGGLAAEIVEHGVTGFVLDEPSGDDAGGLPRVGIEALRRVSASGACQGAMRRGYSVDAVAGRHADVYRRLARRGAFA